MERLDLKGTVCPYPVIAVNKRLKEIKKRGIDKIKLEVVVTDCDALKSIPEVVKKIGAKVEDIKEEDGTWTIIIRMRK